jgi:CubicO group peptidase (beta-lactamase class C family)
MAERHWPQDPKPTNAQGQPNGYYYMRKGEVASGHSREDVASVQKSVVSALVGIAKHKGLIELNDPASKHLGVGWSKATAAQEGEITIRHLITMSSGLTVGLKYEKDPGTKWMYNTTAYSGSLRAVAAASGLTNNELTGAWLTERIGMRDSRWEPRPWVEEARDANAVGFVTTARDLARFGLLIQANGDWDGQTIIADKDYLRESLQPSQTMNPEYGYLWWLNRPHAPTRNRTQMIPAAPDDLVGAHGALIRRLHVVPSLGLVVTRLGDNAGQAFNNEFWKRLMAAAPGNH